MDLREQIARAIRNVEAENAIDNYAIADAVLKVLKPVGEAGSMPGTTGFTMACFYANEVPIGSKLYVVPFVEGE